MNKLIVIGCMGNKTCYLNLEEGVCIKRYCEKENITIEEFKEYETNIDAFEFEDEFYAYDAGAN